MKFIYITDTHGMGSTPGSRLDNYPEALLKKMEYIGSYAKEINATGIIHGGDWLHTPDVSESFIRDFSKIINSYPCAVYGVLGNHDLYGANPETFTRTSFGIAEGLGIFNRLYIDKPCIIDNKVSLTGMDSHFNLDKNGVIDDYTNSNVANGTIGIHVVHGMLVEKEWPLVDCTVISNIYNKCNSHIILSGHEHTGFGVKVLYNSDGKKVIFCNPGSLSRITASVGDVRKDVRMAVITIDDDYNVDIVNLPNSVVSSASEVIDREKLLNEKKTKENLDSFLTKINSTSIDESFNVYDALSSIESEINDNDVIDECRKQLEIAESEIKE